MRLSLMLVLSGILWLGWTGAVEAQQASTEEASVRAAVEDYRSAILASRGEAAADLVSAATLSYYGRMREQALYGDSSSVGRETISDRLMVLMLRQVLTPEALLGMSSRELFAYAVQTGLIGRESVQRLEFGRVRVEGDAAAIEFQQAGAPSGLFFPVVREGGRWRVHLVSLLSTANTALAALAQQQGVSEDALILMLIEASRGRAVESTIWQAPYAR